MNEKIILLGIAPKSAKKKRPRRPSIKIPKKRTRELLLEALRYESNIRSGTAWQVTKDSLLFDLAQAAMHSRKRHITWRGVRFPLTHSIWLQVRDPETGAILVQTAGGVL